jgi:hypothetical protein
MKNNNPIEKTVYFTTQNAKIAGNFLKISRFGREIMLGNRKSRKKDDEQKVEESEKEKMSKEEIRAKSLRRARKMIFDLVYANAWHWHQRNGKPYRPIFITFTFRKNIVDLDYANKEFKNFIRRFGYSIRGKETFLKYLNVVEFQERGAIHFHTVFFNLPFVERIYDKVRDMWRQGIGEGSTRIESVYNEQGIILYLSEYLTKSVNDDRLEARKSYFASKGLKKPITISFEELVNLIRAKIPDELKGRFYSYECDFLKQVDVVEYNLKYYPDIFEFIHKEIIEKYL